MDQDGPTRKEPRIEVTYICIFKKKKLFRFFKDNVLFDGLQIQGT
jgi:hypothetical protein